MTSQYEMQFPFTTKKEILYWETRYIDAQKPERQHQEEDVRKIKCSVEDKGYLTKCELMEMARWKRQTLPSQMVNNPVGHVEKITAAAFRPGDDWEKLEKLIDIDGVGQPVASTILHLYDPERYPIFDPHALYSIRIKKKDVEGDKKFWKEYVKFCREKAECHDVCMRTLDRALYKFSKERCRLRTQNHNRQNDVFRTQTPRVRPLQTTKRRDNRRDFENIIISHAQCHIL